MNPTDVHTVDSIAVAGLQIAVAPPSDRRTLQLTVERDASLVLRAPRGTTVERATRFVDDKRTWIYRKLAAKDALVGTPVRKDFVDGEGFAYLGRSHRLLVTDDIDDVRLERGRFLMTPSAAADGTASMRHWYARAGTPWAARRALPWQQRLGLDDISIHVADLGHRWGSARQPDRVNIHWATFQLPPSLVDYVLAHELTHLREPAHTLEFWNRLHVVMPNAQARRNALRHIGATVWLGEEAQGSTRRV